MAIFIWSPQYSVKVKQIDEEHKKLIEILNELHNAMLSAQGKTVIEQVINKMANYTKVHFSSEEGLMEKYGYPDLPSHKKEHELFIEKVNQFSEKYKSGEALLSIEIMEFLKNWLMGHINGVDKQYSSFFNEKGLR